MNTNRKKLIIILALMSILTVVTLYLLVNAQKQVKQTAPQTKVSLPSPRPTTTPSPKVVMSFDPKELSIAKGKTVILHLTLDSSKEINGSDIYIYYDKNFLTLTDSKPGTLFPVPIIAAKNRKLTNGSILFSVATTKPTQTKGTMVDLYFQALAAGTTKVTIGAKTIVSFKGGQTTEMTKLPLPVATINIVQPSP